MRCKTLFPALITTLLLFTAAQANADKTIWSSVAMACTPTNGTLEQANYVTTAGRVKHKPNRVGTITFICPVHERPDISWSRSTRIEAFANKINPTGDILGQIHVALRSVHRRTGAVRTELSTTFASTSSSTPVVTLGSQPRYINWSDRDRTYYVQFSILRPNIVRTGGVEQFRSVFGVQLLDD